MLELQIADCRLQIFAAFLLATAGLAQESPTPFASPISSPIPEETPSPTPEQTRPATPARNVQLRFVPPPMEGTISLGIFDSNQKLVRVLHREAKIDNFTIDENALKTTWDGKNDAGEDLPPGKYRARGYMVGDMKIEEIGTQRAEGAFIDAPDSVRVDLVANPLVSDTRSSVYLAADLDRQNAYLKTTDSLPLRSITTRTPGMGMGDVALLKGPDKSLSFFFTQGGSVREFRITGADKMMAFDCGDFELK